jgi:sugar lactone lactonase YvrE
MGRTAASKAERKSAIGPSQGIRLQRIGTRATGHGIKGGIAVNPRQASPASASPRGLVRWSRSVSFGRLADPRHFAALALLTLACLVVGVGNAGAELRRTTVTSEFGPDGTSATSFTDSVNQIDFNEKSNQLLVMTEGVSIGQVSTGPTTTLSVDPGTGHLYLATGNKVREYDAASPAQATEVSVIEPGSTVRGVAIDAASGKVYVARSGHTTIEVFGALSGSAHPLLETFGSVNQPAFGNPAGMAVDQSSGDLLVIDTSAGTVSRWHADGTASNFSALGTNVIDGAGGAGSDKTPQEGLSFGGAGEIQIAVDNSGTVTDGDIYVTQGGQGLIDIFSQSGEYLGQLTKTNTGTPFSEPCGVAVDPSGAVYIGDYGNRVRKFRPSANPPIDGDNVANFNSSSPCTVAAGAGPSAGLIFIGQYGGQVTKRDSTSGGLQEALREVFTFDATDPGNVTPVPGGHFVVGGGGLAGLAVAPDTGNVYVASEAGGLFGYTGAGTPLPGFPVTGLGNGSVCGVSVDAEGELLVGHGGGRLEFVDPAGNALRGFSLDFSPCLVQVDRANDDLYAVYQNSGIVLHLWYQFDYSYQPGYYTQINDQAPSDIAVDPVTRNLLTSANSEFPFPQGSHELQEFAFATGTKVNAIKFQSRLSGMAAGSDGTAYLGLGKKVGELPLAAVPKVQTGAAIGPNEVSGSVDPDGEGPIVDCHVQWGTSADYWLNTNETPCAEATPISDAQAVTAQLPGLTPGTTYHYRFVAGNANDGGVGYGGDQTIKAPLVADLKTEAASGITRSAATLNGSFTGNGTSATYYFKWSKDPSFLTNKSPAAPASLGAVSGHTPVSIELTGLEPQTTYYYRVVVTNGAGTSEGLIRSFNTVQYVQETTTKPVTGLTPDTVTLNGEFVGTGEQVEYHFEWGPTTSYGNDAPAAPVDVGMVTGPTPVSTQLTAIEGSETYHYRLVATSPLGTSYGADETFSTPVGAAPSVGGTAVSGVGTETATLEAEITPNRRATIYLFEYGTDPEYRSLTALSGPIPGAPNGPNPVSAAVEGLEPGTLYHYRAVATNFSGTTYGPDSTFRTPAPPSIQTVTVSSLTPTSAAVAAVVRPNRGDTTVHFEYGPTGGYGSRTAESAILAGEAGQESSEAALTGLAPGTTYHLRAVATNPFGATASTDQSFKTPGGEQPPPPPPPGKTCKHGFVKRHGRCVRKRHHRHHRPGRARHGQD